jgi:hypothetical protein
MAEWPEVAATAHLLALITAARTAEALITAHMGTVLTAITGIILTTPATSAFTLSTPGDTGMGTDTDTHTRRGDCTAA